MRITQEADYALRIVTSLARSGTVCGAAELAESEGVPPRFAHKILRKLMQGGMIKSHPGAKGGYSLNILPEQLTMLDVIELIEGPFALSKCADEIYKQANVPQPFSSVSEMIYCNKQNINEAWETCLTDFYAENDYIKNEEKEYISQIGNCLSLADKDRQSEGLKTIMDNLDKIEKKADEKTKKDGKMAMRTSMICAVLLIILII